MTPVWRPSPNYGYPSGTHGRNGHGIVAIVDHITAGGLALDWLRDPKSGASAHYVVGRDGSIYQLVADADAAWGCGIDFGKGWTAYRSDLGVDWIADCWQRNYSPNLVTLNVEHECAVGQSLTEPQYLATAALHRQLCESHAIARDDSHIVGHCRIDAVNRPNDPGLLFPWERLLADLAA